ncbi:MAG: hypothetical protein EHM41_23980 [Chloroflexi bacterium]|nr:MAG: hypothetical protein EHM41_23980 [Chloroflexota bacterium]
MLLNLFHHSLFSHSFEAMVMIGATIVATNLVPGSVKNAPITANQITGSFIQGCIFMDANIDDVREDTEMCLPGITVELHEETGTLVDTVVSPSSGYYTFTNLMVGSYFLEFKQPSNYVFSCPNVGTDDERDSDIDPFTGRSQIIRVGAPGTTHRVDAGLQGIPTVVYLASFQPTRIDEDHVVVEWETALEIDTIGFNIYRADSSDGEQINVNDEIILGQALGSPSGAIYQYIDETGISTEPFYYWLEHIRICSAKVYGPEMVEPVSVTMHSVFLPFLSDR